MARKRAAVGEPAVADRAAGAVTHIGRRYADLHEHLEELKRRGLLLTIDRPIDKDAELHPLVRWQFVGGIEEHERRAFLFTNVVDGRGRRYRFPVVVGAFAGNRAIYGAGMRAPLEEVRERWDRAIANPIPPRIVEKAVCQEVVIEGAALEGEGNGLDMLPIPDLHAGFRRRADAHRDQRHHPGSGDRHPEPRHLPRRAEGARPAGRAHVHAHRRRGRLSALPEAPATRRKIHALRDRAGLLRRAWRSSRR